MTLLGKIFTVMIFIMSVAFMLLAITVYMTHVNWKLKASNPNPGPGEQPGLEQQLKQQQDLNTAKEQEIQQLTNQLAAERAARRHALSALRTKVVQAEADLVAKEQQLAQLQAAHSTAQETLRTASTTLAKYEAENETLRTDMKTLLADRDTKFDKVVELSNLLNAAQSEFENLQERQGQLAAELADRRRVMDLLGLRRNHDVEKIAPKVDGLVTAVNDTDLIEISIGFDDGLREGHKVDVFRDNSYLGRAEVRRTYPDRAVAEIMKGYREGIIKKGDNVATRLTAERQYVFTN